MDNSNKGHDLPKLRDEISRLSSENNHLRKIVGLMQENVELRFILRDHGTYGKSFSPPPPAEKPNDQKEKADSLTDTDFSSSDERLSIYKPQFNNKNPYLGNLEANKPLHKSCIDLGVHSDKPKEANRSQNSGRLDLSGQRDKPTEANISLHLGRLTLANRSLHVGSLALASHTNKPRSKPVPLKGYDSSDSSSESLIDRHGREQRKFAYSVTKSHTQERKGKESGHSQQVEGRAGRKK
ncbi:hypothetical protein GDO81_002595 [Engystomops pustulosus]|uniref:Uncharacterized protein n=1 Tax=Engystomops pustulosus TaxID=76066 RepID=A0AAV7DLE5_ENGPU|nr:hypothetical protein GDO81_002595 [Engystomops pustulosus]